MRHACFEGSEDSGYGCYIFTLIPAILPRINAIKMTSFLLFVVVFTFLSTLMSSTTSQRQSPHGEACGDTVTRRKEHCRGVVNGSGLKVLKRGVETDVLLVVDAALIEGAPLLMVRKDTHFFFFFLK